MTGIKLCGISDMASLEAVNSIVPEYVGFVAFAPSPRHVSPARYGELMAHLSPSIKSVIVTVDAEAAMLDEYIQASKPSALQLHGSETPEQCATLRQKYDVSIIKALAVAETDDLRRVTAYTDAADMLLLDAKPVKGEMPGGNAKKFDWKILNEFALPFPWFLSGGLHIGNVQDALRIAHPPFIDVSSGIESSKGVKSPELISQFTQKVREYDRLHNL